MNEFERIKAFLTPFSKGLEGYQGLTKANRRTNGTEEENKTWSTFANWFISVENGETDLNFSSLGNDQEWEFYFTPAVLKTNRRTESNFKSSNAIWIDFDQPVDWVNMVPKPSIVIRSSPKKYHCYWLLDAPIIDVNDMRYWNSRFLAHFNSGDKSGIDATQLLKLPFGLNLKHSARLEDGTPFEPTVAHFNTEMQYSLSDFENMVEPEAPNPVVDIEDTEAPVADRGFNHYLSLYEVTRKTKKLVLDPDISGPEKRSGALFSAELSLYRELSDESKVYQCLFGSPADKFTQEHGQAKGSVYLWRDVSRSVKKVEASKAKLNPANEGYVRQILKDKSLSKDEKSEMALAHILQELQTTGKFLCTFDNTSYYADTRVDGRARLYTIDKEAMSPFVVYMSHRFGLKAGTDSTMIRDLLGDVQGHCLHLPATKMHDFARYDKSTLKVYVDRYDGSMYVLDGRTVSREPYGYDGVFFNPKSGEFPVPFNYIPDLDQEGLLEKLILSGPNYNSEAFGANREEVQIIMKTWIASMFFPEMMNVRPVVKVYGPSDSGKTTVFQALSLMISGGAMNSVTDIPDKPESFDNHVTNNHYLFYDNVEVHKKEKQDQLSRASTGYTVMKRKYYTTNQMVSFTVRAFLGITTTNTEHIKEDVVQRMVLFPVERAGEDAERKVQSDIFDAVEENRDTLWSELLNFVNRILYIMRTSGLTSEYTNKNFRLTEFGRLLDTAALMEGYDPSKLRNYLLKCQSEVMGANDPLFEVLRRYIEGNFDGIPLEEQREGFTTSPSKLFHELNDNFSTQEFRKVYRNLKKFGERIKQYSTRGDFKRQGLNVKVRYSGNNTVITVYPNTVMVDE